MRENIPIHNLRSSRHRPNDASGRLGEPPNRGDQRQVHQVNTDSRIHQNTSAPWPVAVFAYNESANIIRCLSSLDAATVDTPIDIYVLANGCTDNTDGIVAEYAQNHPHVHLIRIKLGDKASAWNTYVHDVAAPLSSNVHFFMDADVQVCPGALAELMAGLERAPAANAAAAVPFTGRSANHWRQRMLENNEIAGNLYALRGSFIRRIQDTNIRLPKGLIGDDNLVAFLACRDLDMGTNACQGKIVCCEKAGFHFRSLAWWHPGDLMEYWEKQLRYSKRGFQFQLLRLLLDECNFAGMPNNVDRVYQLAFDRRKLHRTGMNPLADYLAKRHIRQRLRQLASEPHV